MTDPEMIAMLAEMDQAAALCRESVSNMVATYRATLACPGHQHTKSEALLAITQEIIEYENGQGIPLAPFLGMAVQMIAEQEGTIDDHDTHG